MSDPVSAGTIIGAANVASKAGSLLLKEDTAPRFGFGQPEREKRCAALNVFLTTVGVATTTRHRLRLPPSHTALQAREALAAELGEAVEQDEIQDENSFTLSAEISQVSAPANPSWHPRRPHHRHTSTRRVVATHCCWLAQLPMSELSSNCNLGLRLTYRQSVAERSGTGVIGAPPPHLLPSLPAHQPITTAKTKRVRVCRVYVQRA